jgi:hypothetical protein
MAPPSAYDADTFPASPGRMTGSYRSGMLMLTLGLDG